MPSSINRPTADDGGGRGHGSGAELGTADAHYVSMALAGKATDDQRAYFDNAAAHLVSGHGAEASYWAGPICFSPSTHLVIRIRSSIVLWFTRKKLPDWECAEM